MKNKKGYKMFSFMWVIFIVMVVGVFVAAATMVYGADFDVRNKEAGFLAEKVYDCIVEEGFFNSDLMNNFDFGKCYLEEKLFSKEIFSFKIVFSNSDGEVFSLVKGRQDISQKCALEGDKNLLPSCFEKKRIINYKENGEIKRGSLYILTASENYGGGK